MLLVRNGPLSEVALSTMGYNAAIEGSTRVYRTLAPCLQYCSMYSSILTKNSTTPWTWQSEMLVVVRWTVRVWSVVLSVRGSNTTTPTAIFINLPHPNPSKWMHRRRLSEAVLCVSTHVHKQSPGRSVVRFRRRQAGSSGNRLHGKGRERYQEAIQVRGYNCQHSTVVKT
jgi:hypothetical protein